MLVSQQGIYDKKSKTFFLFSLKSLYWAYDNQAGLYVQIYIFGFYEIIAVGLNGYVCETNINFYK